MFNPLKIPGKLYNMGRGAITAAEALEKLGRARGSLEKAGKFINNNKLPIGLGLGAGSLAILAANANNENRELSNRRVNKFIKDFNKSKNKDVKSAIDRYNKNNRG